jgi:hypothetical protein
MHSQALAPRRRDCSDDRSVLRPTPAGLADCARRLRTALRPGATFQVGVVKSPELSPWPDGRSGRRSQLSLPPSRSPHRCCSATKAVKAARVSSMGPGDYHNPGECVRTRRGSLQRAAPPLLPIAARLAHGRREVHPAMPVKKGERSWPSSYPWEASSSSSQTRR